MFHVVGSTPEAPTLDAALQSGAPNAVHLVRLSELRQSREQLTTSTGDRLTAVSMGTPHASLDELRRLAVMLGDRRVHPDVECLVSTGRDVLQAATDEGIASRLREAGVELLVDTCSYIAPILRRTDGAVMTDSGKWAYYAPGNVGASVVLGSTAECVRSAVAGRVIRDDSVWGPAS
jgi:predicted aconitase